MNPLRWGMATWAWMSCWCLRVFGLGEGDDDAALVQWVRNELFEHDEVQAADHTVWVAQPDFSDRVPSPRKFVSTYPQQMVISMPMENNGIKVEMINVGGNDVPHAVFPMSRHFVDMVAARSTLNEDGVTFSYEFGELRWFSALTDPKYTGMPGSVVGFAERFFVYEHEGVWPAADSNEDTLKSEEAARQEPPQVTADAVPRARLVMEFLNASGSNAYALVATADPLAAKDLATHLKENPLPSEADKIKAAAMKTRMRSSQMRVNALPRGTAPKHIVTSCHHISEHPLLIQDYENNVAKVPLGMILPTFRGQTIFAPSYHFGPVMGHSTYAIEDGYLNVYVASTMNGRFDIQRKNHGTSAATSTFRVPPTVFISSPGGTDLPSAEVQAVDLRATMHNPVIAQVPRTATILQLQEDGSSIVGETSRYHAMFKKYAKIPMSHVYLFENIEESCTPHVFAKLNLSVHDFDFYEMDKKGYLTAEEWSAVFSGTLDTLACGKVFVRGAQDYSNGLDYLEMVVWDHFLKEVSPEHRLNAVRGDLEYPNNGWHWKDMPVKGARIGDPCR